MAVMPRPAVYHPVGAPATDGPDSTPTDDEPCLPACAFGIAVRPRGDCWRAAALHSHAEIFPVALADFPSAVTSTSSKPLSFGPNVELYLRTYWFAKSRSATLT